MRPRKVLERRTFNQDQFDILIKKLKMGEASFGDLTELDAIVNRDPDIREKVLIAMEDNACTPDEFDNVSQSPFQPSVSSKGIINKIALFLKRLFNIYSINLSQSLS